MTRLRAAAPVLLDLAGFVAIVYGTSRLFGDWAWLAAGALLILAAYRTQT